MNANTWKATDGHRLAEIWNRVYNIWSYVCLSVTQLTPNSTFPAASGAILPFPWIFTQQRILVSWLWAHGWDLCVVVDVRRGIPVTQNAQTAIKSPNCLAFPIQTSQHWLTFISKYFSHCLLLNAEIWALLQVTASLKLWHEFKANSVVTF